MRIYTSYFARQKKLRTAGIKTVSIAIKQPTFFYGPQYLPLAPPWSLVRGVKYEGKSQEWYDKHFTAQLQALNPDEVVKEIEQLSDGKDIALLCYEKNVDECHRKTVGEWLKNNGYEVEEWHPPRQRPKPKDTQTLLF